MRTTLNDRVRLGTVLALVAFGLAARDARAQAVAEVMTSKTLPAATIEVIDPESGSSSGTTGSDVKLAAGDVILFKSIFFPVFDKQLHGVNGYLTEYVPPRTQVVGVRIVDENGVTIEPNLPGLTLDGCTGGGCNSGTGAQLHGDTGVFYSTDPRTDRSPTDKFLVMRDNGYTIFPAASGIVKDLLNTTSPFKTHNKWDEIQVRAFSGMLSVPHLHGSPVAGPGTHYKNEAYESGSTVVYSPSIVGPWQRILYPGHKKGSGVANGTDTVRRAITDPSPADWVDLTPATPLPAGTKAVRFALGETRSGEFGFAEIALKVLGVPIDDRQGKDVSCAEAFGSDVIVGTKTAAPAWDYHIPSPACTYLSLLFDFTADKPLAPNGTVVTYTLHGKNLSLQTDNNVVVKVKFSGNEFSVSSTGGGTLVGNCDGDGLSCIVYPTMTLSPSEEFTFAPRLTVAGSCGGGSCANLVFATYTSQRIPAPVGEKAGFTTQSLVLTKPVTVLKIAGVTLNKAFVSSSDRDVVVSGTLRALGSADATLKEFNPVLPTGWTMVGNATVGGATFTCSSGRCTGSLSLLKGSTHAFSFTVRRPATGISLGLYPVDLQLWAAQAQLGPDTEWYFSKIAQIPVDQPRSAKPVLTCPIPSAATAITGTTTEGAGTTIRLYFNLIQRASGTSSGTNFSIPSSAWAAFGNLYGGLEVRATAQAPGELESELSDPCSVTHRPACNDQIDNDGDGLVDFPADPGCAGPTDGDETNPNYECSDNTDNDGDGATDFPADVQCIVPEGLSERGECADGVDNDGDGAIDGGDPSCADATPTTEVDYFACMDGVDNDNDGKRDFGDEAWNDPGCHSPNDASEATEPRNPENPPRILVAFDTSGSMNWNVCADDTFTGGDGSLECPGSDVAPAPGCAPPSHGNSQPDDSRLYKVKRGVADVVAGFGEVEWGLMRFFQRPVTWACPTSRAGLQSGGWQGGGAAPCEGGFNAGELLVSFSPENPYDLLAWMDNTDNYTGTAPPRMDIELRGSGTTPLGGILYSAHQYIQREKTADGPLVGACRPYVVILVTDGKETCESLDYPAQVAADLLADGVKVYVIGFATPDPDIQANLNAIAAAGGTGSAILVEDEAALSAAVAGIIGSTVLVEECNGVDDDCDGQVDELPMPGVGGPCDPSGRAGIGECTYGAWTCVADGMGGASIQCTGGVGPVAETCNGKDDDCDDQIDEELSCVPCVPTSEVCDGVDNDCDGGIDEGALPNEGTSCGFTIGECEPGTLQCDRTPGSPTRGELVCVGAIDPAPEICDGKDNDCNGKVDDGLGLGTPCDGPDTDSCNEGVLACDLATGQVVCNDTTPNSVEVCNGADDDCNGTIDDPWQPTVGTACEKGTGACRATGIWACNATQDGLVCTAPDLTGGPETCNGLDDDCDTEIDEEAELGPPVGDPCGSSTCGTGTIRCQSGILVCDMTSQSSPEVCDGIDNDCDGNVDEPSDLGSPIGDPCTPTGTEPTIGTCRPGQNICRNGGVVCDGYIGPGSEICNGLDDDCDGVADDAAPCPADSVCEEGACRNRCGAGEFPCPNGFYCKEFPRGDGSVDRLCMPDPCDAITCPTGWECRREDGDCHDKCLDLECRPGEQCLEGFCRDCFDPRLACASGQLCKRNADGVGVCQDDPCLGVDCGQNGFCVDGECRSTTCNPACAANEVCISGTCQPDRCLGKECAENEICNPKNGQCEFDRCGVVSCPPGQACNPDNGACIDDPCIGVRCPIGRTCQIRDGEAVCLEPPRTPGADILAAGGGGCTCATGRRASRTGTDASAALLMLAVASWAIRRRVRP